MSLEDLDKLQEIRQRRLEKQQKVVMERRSHMESTEMQLIEARQNLEQFRQWRLNHQEDLFKGLQGQSCSPQGMFEYRAKIEKLAHEEENYKELIKQAEAALKSAQDAYTQAKQAANALALKNEKTKGIIEIQEKKELELARAKE